MSNALQDAPVLEDARKLDWRILLLALATFVLGTDVLIVIGVLPTIARELRVTEGVTGQLITAFSLVYGSYSSLCASPLLLPAAEQSTNAIASNRMDRPSHKNRRCH